jgi:hypothetical protein
LKAYFDQDGLLYPVDVIAEKVELKDFNFFLSNKNFLKVADTLEIFQESIVDLDSQSGKDFIVFKK